MLAVGIRVEGAHMAMGKKDGGRISPWHQHGYSFVDTA